MLLSIVMMCTIEQRIVMVLTFSTHRGTSVHTQNHYFRVCQVQISQLSFCPALKSQKWTQFHFEQYDLVNESYAIGFVPNKMFIPRVQCTQSLWIFNEYRVIKGEKCQILFETPSTFIRI